MQSHYPNMKTFFKLILIVLYNTIIMFQLFMIPVARSMWIIVMQQFILIFIIIARWLTPKGDITRDELSVLLIGYLATSSDIIDFFSIISEDETLAINKLFVDVVLFCWTISLIQFPFIKTAKHTQEKVCDDELIRRYGRYHCKRWKKQLEEQERTSQSLTTRGCITSIKTMVETEIWSILLVIFTQDGPFLIVRLVSIIVFSVQTYSNFFFVVKNIFVLILQIYRIMVLFVEHRKDRNTEERERKEFVLRVLYRNSWPASHLQQEVGSMVPLLAAH